MSRTVLTIMAAAQLGARRVTTERKGVVEAVIAFMPMGKLDQFILIAHQKFSLNCFRLAHT
jgi:hypothetical protein